MHLIISLIISGFVGWLAGKLMKTDFSWIGNIGVGIVGGIVGRLVLGLVGIQGKGTIGGIIVSVAGACILIAAVRFIRKKK